MPLPGGFTVGRGITVYGAFSAASREAEAYLQHDKEMRDAQSNNAALANADIAYQSRLATSIPAAGGIGLTIREAIIDPIAHAFSPGWTSASDVQNILRQSQQGAEKAQVIKQASDFRRSLNNTNYLSQDVNDQEQSRREREVARDEQRQRIRDNQTAQVNQLSQERDRKLTDARNNAKKFGLVGASSDAIGPIVDPEALEREQDAIRKDFDFATRKVSAATAAEMAINDQRFSGEEHRDARERDERLRDALLQKSGFGARLAGDTDMARRIDKEREIEGEQNAANQRSPAEGQYYANEIAPRKRLELEQEINRERVLEAKQSQDRINDATSEGEEAMLHATKHHYEAVTQTLKRSIDDQVKSLRERADAEQDLTKKGQFNAEANATAAAGQVKLKALELQQQTEMGDRAAGINAQSDVTELRTQHRNLEAQRKLVTDRYDAGLRHLDAGDTEGRAALARSQNVDLAAIEEQRNRSIKDIRNQTGVMALQNVHRPYSAQLKEINDRYDKLIEDATGDPQKQGALGKQRDEAIDALHQKLKHRTPFKSTMTDIYFSLLGSAAADNGDFAKEAEDARRTLAATDKLDKAAQKLLDSKPITILR